MKLLDVILHHSVRELTRAAAVLALVALAIMSYSIVSPRPLPVVLAMSVGHVIGGAALAFYLIAVVLHAARQPRRAGAGHAPAGEAVASSGEPPAA